jgi:YVTN family beta-propeller protein
MRNFFAFACLAIAGCNAAPPSGSPDMGPPPFVANCTAGTPSADAKVKAGKQSDGTVILPGGRKLTPAGKLFLVGGFPIAVKVLPGDRYAVTTDGAYEADQRLRVIDLQAADPQKAVVSDFDYPGSSSNDPGLFYGLAVTADGKRVYASNGSFDPVPMGMAGRYDTIDVFDLVGDPPMLMRGAPIQIPAGMSDDPVTCGLALSADESLLYVATVGDNAMSIINVAAGPGFGTVLGRTSLPGLGAYDVAVDDKSHTAFVSLWGGQMTAKDQYVDGVVAVDVTNPMMPMAMPAPIPTGKAAEAELIVAGKLYVANADADTISIVDVASKTVKSMPVTAAMIVGASPTALAIDDAAGRIYVANSGENSVVALDLATLAVKGRIPTAYYPTAVAVRSDGSLVIACGRGLGTGPTKISLDNGYYDQGMLEVIPRPSDSDLMTGDTQVTANTARMRMLETATTCPDGATPSFPLPPKMGAPTPIKYVFLVVKENKTYDAILGDLAGSDGDPSLVMFGKDNTPNVHALASTYVNLDNFYSHAERSTQGHQWTVSAISNDYVEKAWATMSGGRNLFPIDSVGPGIHAHLGMPGSGSIWSHLDAAKVPYHNYGELTNTEGAKTHLDNHYPGLVFNLDVDDNDKAKYILSVVTDPMTPPEPFSYIVLPQDHTYGTNPNHPTPQWMVSNNDEALGRLVDGISHGPYWSESIIFVVEDDPQDGGDHVEGHRSIGVVISPWVKRGTVSSVNYDLGSLYRTIDQILGVGPMNLSDGEAAAMVEIFSPTPDMTPYTFAPGTVPMMFNPADAPLAEESKKIDFTRPDTAHLGRILWKATHGRDAEPPWTIRAKLVDEDDD